MKAKYAYPLLVSVMLATSIVPSLTPLKPETFVGVANSSLPRGVPEHTFGTLSEEPVFKALIENGAQVILVNDLKTKVGHTHAAGLWVPQEGAVKLLVGDYSYADYLSTLKHEAIHMAQSCSGFGMTQEAYPIGLPITQYGMNKLEEFKYTDPEYYHDVAEREAHSNDYKSDEFIITLLDEHCGSKPWIKASGKFRSFIQTFFLPKAARN